MKFVIHNVSDVVGHVRTISVRHIKIPPGANITLLGPLLSIEVSGPPEVSGLVALREGSPLPPEILRLRNPPRLAPVEEVVVEEVVVEEVVVEEVAVEEAVHVDWSELTSREMALIFEEVSGQKYKGRRRKQDLLRALEGLDPRQVAEAIG
jgi:hypothetical protein